MEFGVGLGSVSITWPVSGRVTEFSGESFSKYIQAILPISTKRFGKIGV